MLEMAKAPEKPEKLDSLELLDKEDLIKLVKTMMNGGISISFYGKRSALEIAKRVRPRVTRRVNALHVGTPEEQSKNMIVEGENLQAMVTLYKFRGQVDLILTDPPYNTGQQFRYNDRWDTDPNDPDLGEIVTRDDGSRHTKWMKAMMPRLHMMKAMLKPGGVIAMCIDENELFHLGMMMDEVFDEENRIAIINWEKSYQSKNDKKHVSSATEYVLVYAKDKTLAKTGLMPRSDAMDAKYKNPDNDPEGEWRMDSPVRSESRERDKYAIQSPYTGALHYPGGGSWKYPRAKMKAFLEELGSEYIEKQLSDNRPKALVISGAPLPAVDRNRNYDDNPEVESEKVSASTEIAKARKKAEKRLAGKVWPQVFFSKQGYGRPGEKRYLKYVKKGKVPITYWADDDYSEPFELGCESWDHEESGHTQAGVAELDAIVGGGHNFDTVKPLRLFKKIIQLWCPPLGLVLDPYAGSGTTGHAVLEMNYEAKTDRRFILIEQGSPENGDKYARSLTWERIKRVITGERPNEKGKLLVTAEPLPGGFEFRNLTKQIDAKTVLSMKRDELIDVVITSHWETGSRNGPTLIRIEDPAYTYLVGRNELSEGYFIIWDGDGPIGQLDSDSYRIVLQEGKKAGLKAPYHVYARYEVYQSKNVYFYKIPDKILAHLGLNESSDPYNDDQDE